MALPLTAAPQSPEADAFVERLEAHLRDRMQARARPRSHAAAKAARCAFKLLLFVLLAASATAAGFFAARWEDARRSKDAEALGRQFLTNRSLDMSAFVGPVVRTSPNSRTTYVWLSVSPGRNLLLNVTPGGSPVCLYQVLSASKLKPIDCADRS